MAKSHLVSITGTSGTGSASRPWTTVRFMASSALTSAKASSSAVPMPMMSCMCVGRSWLMARSSHHPVTIGSWVGAGTLSPAGPAPFPNFGTPASAPFVAAPFRASSSRGRTTLTPFSISS